MQDKIQKDMIAAMKNKEILKRETLRLLLSEIKKIQIDSKKQLSEPDIIKIIKQGIKSREEAIKLFQQGNRNDLVEKTQQEVAILNSYLPRQLSPGELEKLITGIISDLGAATPRDTGKVMQAVMSKYASQVDGKTVQQIVTAKLKPAAGSSA